MRIAVLSVMFALMAILFVLLGTYVLEKYLTWILETNEVPVELDRLPPPNLISKGLIWLNSFYSSHDQCKLYLAESTIPGAGMGVFTSVNVDESSRIGPGEIVIPITFSIHSNRLWKAWKNHVWLPDESGLDLDITQRAFIPGVGSFINSNYHDLTNVDEITNAKYDTAQLHRIKDVGSGAFTPFHQSSASVFRAVPAGSELTILYGGTFFHKRVPIDKASLKTADKIITNYEIFLLSHPEISFDLKEAIWSDLIQNFPAFPSLQGLRGFSSLPTQTWEYLQTEKSLKDSTRLSLDAMRMKHTHSISWLQSNAFCMDLIAPGPSTLAQAGRGAFATRFIAKGTVISFAPLIAVAAPKHELNGWSHPLVANELVRNYSFGHPDSSILLTPHGAGVALINHSLKRNNVEVRWPTKELPSHKLVYLDMPAALLAKEENIRLSLEYVAKQNIYPGEELFLNYGQEWEREWERHVQQWQPETEWFVHPSQISKTEPFKTESEIAFDPYPSNLFTLCIPSFSEDENGNYMYEDPLDTPEWAPCKILSRRGYTYTVAITEFQIEINNVPQVAIKFETLPGKSDWALAGAFRKEISLPDTLLPAAWKQ